MKNTLDNYLTMITFFLKEGTGKDAPAEVLLGSQFIGVLYKNEDEGETSYDFNMSILSEDLE